MRAAEGPEDGKMTAQPVCPRDQLPLLSGDEALICAAGHGYPVRRGVPVLLLDDAEPTQPGYWALRDDEFALELAEQEPTAGAIHPYVRQLVLGTCGNLYGGLELDDYPIPEMRLAPGGGSLLDIGSNWGRWCIAAARLGYSPVGIDPALGAALAARQVAAELGANADFLVADGRYLPFADGTFDVVFSYGVLQHFSREDALAAFREAARVVAPGGIVLVQMPNRYGIRSLVQLARRRFREGSAFEVRYWTPRELRAAVPGLEDVALEVDGFFTLNAQAADLRLLRRRHRLIVRLSEAFRQVTAVFPPLLYLADSLYVRARKPASEEFAPPAPGDQ